MTRMVQGSGTVISLSGGGARNYDAAFLFLLVLKILLIALKKL